MTEKLNITYFLEPWVELGRPLLRYHNLRYQLGPQIKSLASRGNKISVIMSQSTFEKCIEDKYSIPNVKFTYISEDELKTIFPNYIDATISLHKNNQTPKEEQLYKDLIEKKLDGKQPDVFISFLSPINFIKKYWKNTLLMYTEFGIFSRSPYPRTFYFDTIGIFEQSYLRQLNNIKIETQKDDLINLDKLRNSIKFEKLPSSTINEIKKFQKNLLVPLQFSNYFGFDATSSFKSQYEFLIHILDSIPNNVGAIVTEHTGWDPVITEHNYSFLKKKYPNLIVTNEILNTANASQAIIKHVDAVASVSSSVALQALFWGKPIFAVGNSHLNTFNAGELKNIKSIVENYNKSENDYKLIHLLKNYYIPDELAYNGEWFENRLKSQLLNIDDSLSHFNKPITQYPFKLLTQNIRNRDHKIMSNNTTDSIRINSNISPSIIDDFSTVSFDIFDTLVQRPFKMPHEMFLFMQEDARKILNDKNFEFHKIRRRSEHYYRTKNPNKDATIEDIYNEIQSEFDITDDQKIKLINLEIEAELHFCEPRETGKKIFNDAKSKNKNIILISDFHIHKSDVEKILKNCGYEGWNKLYVSCDLNKSKKDKDLFEHVLFEERIKHTDIVHVGDNYQSDIINSKSFKMSSIHTEKASELFFNNTFINDVWSHEKNRSIYQTESSQKATSAMLGLAINKLYSDIEKSDSTSCFSGDASKLGYTLFGPLFTSFALELAKNGSEKKYNFLSRDGSIFKKVFEVLYPDYNSNYVYTSRRALSVANIHNEHELLKSLTIPFKPTSLKNLLKSKYGLSEDIIDSLDYSSSSLQIETQVHPSNSLIDLKKLFKTNATTLIDAFKHEREAAKYYLNQYFENDDVMIDVGYSGSLQHYIENITNTKINGFYLMTHLKAKNFTEFNLNMKGFLGDFIDHTSPNSPYHNRITFLEFICSNDEPSLEKYKLSDTKKIDFGFKENTSNISRNRIVSREIQHGILEFAYDFKKFFFKYRDEMELDNYLTTHWIFNFLNKPTTIDATIFNNINHEDSFSGHDQRFIISDIESKLLEKNNILTKEEAIKLIEASDWKEGARAILPTKKGEKKYGPTFLRNKKLSLHDSRKRLTEPSEQISNQPERCLIKPDISIRKRKLNKLIRDPKRFLKDAIRKF